ncbi:MAG: DNA-deoxyinosine glycosylase [Zoogloeaceae bacterium]|jgi:hypoxanthine-DNA glycosylase|nr:DNA-deoxyinosine glycosylase [Zoogloeaceae bacterium]
MHDKAINRDMMADRLTGLAPVFDEHIRCLILGSFPSPASLAARQYYGHRQNQFWRLLGAVLDEPLCNLPYPERLRKVLDHHTGIWDVYHACIRPGALDADIRAGEANDLDALLEQTPRLARICFNGQTAGKFASRLARPGIELHVLPSSSPAYTLSFAAKLARWREAIGYDMGWTTPPPKPMPLTP